MKRFLYLLLLIIFASCNMARIATVTSDKVPTKDNMLVFENDTVRIMYIFWANGGSMRFMVFNKLNVPIYVDLKQSAYIPNHKSMTYWRDETNTESEYTSRSGYFYGVPVSQGKSVSKSVKTERIEIVPPQAMTEIKPCRLVVNITDIPKISATYSMGDTPLQFRNFLAISTNENFDGKVAYIDNNFHVSETKYVSFRGAIKYKKPNRFYTAKHTITYYKDGKYIP